MTNSFEHHLATPASEGSLSQTIRRDHMKQRNLVQAQVMQLMLGLNKEDALHTDEHTIKLEIHWVQQHAKTFSELFESDFEFRKHVLEGNIPAIADRLRG